MISIAPGVRTSGVFDEHTFCKFVVYQSTSGSTSVPKTFGLTLERLLILARRCANDLKEQRILRTGSIEIDAHRLHRISSLIAGNTNVFLRHVNLPSIARYANASTVSSIQL